MDKDTEDRFESVPLVVADAVARALSRPGFKEAWDVRVRAEALYDSKMVIYVDHFLGADWEAL